MGRVISHVTVVFLLLVGLLAFVGLAFGAQALLPLESPHSLPALSAFALAALPALLCLGALSLGYQNQQEYWQDQQATGAPLGIWPVLSALLLGALVAGPIATQLIGGTTRSASGGLAILLMDEKQWLYPFAIVGVAQELSKFIIAEFFFGLGSRTSSSHGLNRHRLLLYIAVAIGFASYLSYLELRSPGQAMSLSAAALLVTEGALFHALLASLLYISTSLGSSYLRPRFTGLLRIALHSTLISLALLGAAFANAFLSLFSDKLNRGYFLGLNASLLVVLYVLAIRLSHSHTEKRANYDDAIDRTKGLPLTVTFVTMCCCLSFYAVSHFRVHRQTSNALQWVSKEGLRFQYPSKWQELGEFPLASSALASPFQTPQVPSRHPATRRSSRFGDDHNDAPFIELEILPSPLYPNLSGTQAIRRLSRFGEGLRELHTNKLSLGPKSTAWLRTTYEYLRQEPGSQNQSLNHATEYAAQKHGYLYIVTLHARGRKSPELDTLIQSTLTLAPEKQ